MQHQNFFALLIFAKNCSDYFFVIVVFSGSFRWLGLFTFAVNSVTQTLTNSQFLCVPACLVGYSDVCTCEMLYSLLYCLSPSPVHLVFALN